MQKLILDIEYFLRNGQRRPSSDAARNAARMLPRLREVSEGAVWTEPDEDMLPILEGWETATGLLGLLKDDGLPVHGRVTILSRTASDLPPDDGPWELEDEVDNLVVDSGKALMAKMMAEQSGFDTGITFCEVGTNATAAAPGDTDIGTVTKRAAITRYIVTGNIVQFRTFYNAADVTAFLKAVGLWGHSTATSTDQTGELFNHAKISFDNTSGTKDLTVLVEVSFG